MNQENLASFIWGVADLLRGTLKQSQYGRVILPFTVLRRLECVLEPTRDQVLEQAKAYQDKPAAMRDRILRNEAGMEFYNTSPLRSATRSRSTATSTSMSRSDRWRRSTPTCGIAPTVSSG